MDDRMNMIFSKSLAEFIPSFHSGQALSQIKRFFAEFILSKILQSLRSFRMTGGNGVAFLLHIKKSSLPSSSCQKNEGKQKGFTLLEVLTALVILSVGLLGLASLTASVIRTNSFSDDFTTATALAQDQLETLVNLSFTDVTLNDTSATNNSTAGLLSTADTDQQDANPVDENGATGNPGSKYTRTTNIWDRTDLVNPATRKDIAVIVSWVDDLGNTRSVSTSTVKANY